MGIIVRSTAILLAAALLAGCVGPGAEAPRTLRILAHESFTIDAAVLAAFEAEHGVEVVVLAKGDAGEILNDAILTKSNPLADLLFGVDNTLLPKAKAADIFEPYEPAGASGIPAKYRLDDAWTVTPLDYGYVNLNYDVAALEARALAPPTSLEELTNATWRGALVVENPATSSPGLAFLLATVAHFGEDGYLDWWRAMKANDVVVAPGWTEAYFTHFAGGGVGDVPLVVSYHTSPPYAAREACTVDGVYVGLDDCDAPEAKALPTRNVEAPGSAWLQIEAIGVLKGAKEPDLARAFVDFALTPAYQSAAAEAMFVYPVVEGVAVPDYYALVEAPAAPATLPPEALTEAKIRSYVDAWSSVMLG